MKFDTYQKLKLYKQFYPESSETVTKEATCVEEGILTNACGICGTSENSPIAPVNHTFNYDALEPARCTLCGEIIPGAGADPENPWYGVDFEATIPELIGME